MIEKRKKKASEGRELATREKGIKIRKETRLRKNERTNERYLAKFGPRSGQFYHRTLLLQKAIFVMPCLHFKLSLRDRK